MMLRRSLRTEASFALSLVAANFGMAMAARMPTITTTISSSMSVKPAVRFRICLSGSSLYSLLRGLRCLSTIFVSGRESGGDGRLCATAPRPSPVSPLLRADDDAILGGARSAAADAHMALRGAGADRGVGDGRLPAGGPARVVRRRVAGREREVAGRLHVRERPVGRVIREVRLLRGHHIAKVRLDRGQLGLVLGGRELRNPDGRQEPDTDVHDQQLDEVKPVTVKHCSLPKKVNAMHSATTPTPQRAASHEVARQ